MKTEKQLFESNKYFMIKIMYSYGVCSVFVSVALNELSTSLLVYRNGNQSYHRVRQHNCCNQQTIQTQTHRKLLGVHAKQ